MPAQLVALTEGPTILLDKPILLLGRHPECDIQLNSRKVSRRHCCIAQVSNYLVVRDLGSTNGVRINGVRVNEGKLKGGDELTVGNFRYQVTWDDKPASVSTPAKGPPIAANEGTAPVAPRRARSADKSPTDPSEDALLESCDEPVPIGKPPKKPALPKSDAPMFPDNVDLRSDSKA
jgi:predicted component of type VI protein secretion system